jgi:hypothetical protein
MQQLLWLLAGIEWIGTPASINFSLDAGFV